MVPAAPGRGEVLVRVKAAGVGPWDAWLRAGKSALSQPLPLTLGSDISGVVEAVGPGVTRFVEGDEVFGVNNPNFSGGYADFAIITAAMLANKPAILPHIDAASVPVVAVTAFQALFEQAGLTPGQSVLVLGAAGNVGAFAVQLAHRAGLQVYATADARDLGYVRCLGADTVFDGASRWFECHLPPIDAVIDLIGRETQAHSFAMLRQGGTLIIGRGDVITTAASRLSRHRLRTILGPGGIGKTTVAAAAAEPMSTSYPDGVWFVRLSTIIDAALVPGAVLATFGMLPSNIDPLTALAAWLREKHLLIRSGARRGARRAHSCNQPRTAARAGRVAAALALAGGSSGGCSAERHRSTGLFGRRIVQRTGGGNGGGVHLIRR
jgi:NADPH:quinone reductase-like Zn-dependent oxidoreductase